MSPAQRRNGDAFMRLRNRPKPQKTIHIKRMKDNGNGSMMVLADPIYMGHHPSISMKVHDLLNISDEKEERKADEFASNIIAENMKQISKNWSDIVVTDEPYANKDAEVENCAQKFGGTPRHVSLREKNSHEYASSLTVFMNNTKRLAGPIMRRIEMVLDKCISEGKPVCVIDSFGVKRYPRRKR